MILEKVSCNSPDERLEYWNDSKMVIRRGAPRTSIGTLHKSYLSTRNHLSIIRKFKKLSHCSQRQIKTNLDINRQSTVLKQSCKTASNLKHIACSNFHLSKHSKNNNTAGGLDFMAVGKLARKITTERFEGRCGYCGIKPDHLHVDHIKPRAAGGTNALENLMPACPSCNNYKGIFSLEDFRIQIAEQVLRARKHSLNFRIAERFGLITVHEVPEIKFYFEKVTHG